MYSGWERMSLGRELLVQTKPSTCFILQNTSLQLKELCDQYRTMEKKAQAIKDCILKQPVWKKENLHPKTWLKSDHVKAFTEFILPKDIAEDGGYDSKEMCEYRFFLQDFSRFTLMMIPQYCSCVNTFQVDETSCNSNCLYILNWVAYVFIRMERLMPVYHSFFNHI